MTKQESREILSSTYTFGDGSVHEIRTDMSQSEVAEIQGLYWLSHNPNSAYARGLSLKENRVLDYKAKKRGVRKKEKRYQGIR